jgi:hypothetical protein
MNFVKVHPPPPSQHDHDTHTYDEKHGDYASEEVEKVSGGDVYTQEGAI